MTENQQKMLTACKSSDPCKTFGGNVSGCAPGLTSIGVGSHQLNPEAAAAYKKMVAAAAADGIKWNITDSYRPLKVQCNILDVPYFESTGKKRKKGTGGTPVAFPGNSNHGWGSALDLVVKYGDPAHKWLTDNSAKFGFSNPFKNPRTEPWHWEHVESSKKLKSGSPLTNDTSGAVTTDATSGDTTSTDTTTTGSTQTQTSPQDMFGNLFNFLGLKNKKKKDEEEPQQSSDDQVIKEELERITELMKKVL